MVPKKEFHCDERKVVLMVHPKQSLKDTMIRKLRVSDSGSLLVKVMGLELVFLMEMYLAVVLDHAWEKMMVGMMMLQMDCH
jgi:hypothetical protein